MEYEDVKNCEIGFLISNIETKTCYIRGGDIFFDEAFLTAPKILMARLRRLRHAAKFLLRHDD